MTAARGDASAAPVIIAAARSPIGTAARSLAAVSAAQLAAPVLAAMAVDLPVSAEVGEVVLGNCMGPGGNVARVAALAAGLPETVPALTVDRQCASGLAAIGLAAALVADRPGVVLAGGVESASTAPWRFWPPTGEAGPVRYGRAPFAPADVGDPDMGPAADALARDFGISRAEQDYYAARSHARAIATLQEGGFADEIVPVGGVRRDDRPRAELTVARLARLRPAFGPDGTATAGNSCGINDGAAAVTLADVGTHRRAGLPGLRVLATATAGLASSRPGLALVPAAQAALARAGLTLHDVDVIEFNEAFAGQILACCRALDLDPERVCRQGGALALGHPWGASGAVLVVRLFSQMVRQRAGRYGLAAIAAGGGQGVALVVEAVR
ncbi:MAG: thiolase family protein [Blastococcus sp.]